MRGMSLSTKRNSWIGLWKYYHNINVNSSRYSLCEKTPPNSSYSSHIPTIRSFVTTSFGGDGTRKSLFSSRHIIIPLTLIASIIIPFIVWEKLTESKFPSQAKEQLRAALYAENISKNYDDAEKSYKKAISICLQNGLDQVNLAFFYFYFFNC